MNYKLIRDLIFPPRCAVCDELLCLGKGLVCQKCRPKIRYIQEPRCFKCGKEVSDVEEEYCFDCQRKKRSYIQGFPCMAYLPPVSDAVVRMKYHNRPEYAEFYGGEIARIFKDEFKKRAIEALIPVPLHIKRFQKRGYNQALLLAKEIEKLTKIPVKTDILYRSSDTLAQKKLSNDERENNLKDAFSAVRTDEDLNTVLIVDDIYTTGATIEACSLALKKIGIENIYYTSVCIGNVV